MQMGARLRPVPHITYIEYIELDASDERRVQLRRFFAQLKTVATGLSERSAAEDLPIDPA